MTATPWGFRDILPEEAQAREEIALTVKGCFREHHYLPVETPLASRVHALLSARSDGVYVSDLDSSNGTFVNGRKIERQLLRHRDVIRVGDWDIRYIDGNVDTQRDTTVAPAL